MYPDLNESGELESIMLFITDISETKRAKEQLSVYKSKLEEAEASHKTVLEHCPLGFCQTDPDGHVVYGNRAWRAYYNSARDRLPKIAEPWLQFLHDDDVQASKDFFQQLQTNPAPTTCEFRLKNETFTIYEGDMSCTSDAHVLVTGFPNTKEDGSLTSMDFWTANISAKKMAVQVFSDKMAETKRLNSEQEKFMDMIGHEIRNPLSAVLHCGEELVDAMTFGRDALDTITCDSTSHANAPPLNQALKKQLDGALDAAETIVYCVQHQKRIVDEVLTLYKLDNHPLPVSTSPVELIPLLQSSLKVSEYELEATGISLAFVEDDSLAALCAQWIMLDPKVFLQIILNFVTKCHQKHDGV